MEKVFGTTFADVRIHVGPQASSLGASALTQGPNIYFAPGQYSPATPHGKQLLAHQLTYVVQQRRGRVINPFASGVAAVRDPSLDAEALRMRMRSAMSAAARPPGFRPVMQAKPALSARAPGAGLHPRSPVIQRALMSRQEQIMAEMRARTQKKANMQAFAKEHTNLYKKKSSAQQKLVDTLSFGGNRSSAAIIINQDKDTMFVSEQSGWGTASPDVLWDLSGGEVIATDTECDRGLHAEMQTIVHLLREWQSEGSVGSSVAYLKDKLRGGHAVAKGKGCCQLCAAILLKLGVNVGYIEPSKYESIWVDPFEQVGLENPWF